MEHSESVLAKLNVFLWLGPDLRSGVAPDGSGRLIKVLFSELFWNKKWQFHTHVISFGGEENAPEPEMVMVTQCWQCSYCQ